MLLARDSLRTYAEILRDILGGHRRHVKIDRILLPGDKSPTHVFVCEVLSADLQKYFILLYVASGVSDREFNCDIVGIAEALLVFVAVSCKAVLTLRLADTVKAGNEGPSVFVSVKRDRITSRPGVPAVQTYRRTEIKVNIRTLYPRRSRSEELPSSYHP